MIYLLIIAVLFGRNCFTSVADGYNIIDKPNEELLHEGDAARGGIIYWVAYSTYYLILPRQRGGSW